jgi:hypothetical protein
MLRRFGIAMVTVFLGLASNADLDYSAALAAANQPPSTRDQVFVACGEHARKAGRRIREIVGAIDGVWDAHVRVYESVAVAPPHARPGGCILYNPVYMNFLMQRLLIHDGAVAEAMLYAIMAHEVGHELHGDFSASRRQVSSETKELQADRFAGYTLERLNIGIDSITPYYSLAGDEFNGGQTRTGNEHGVSMSRTEALKKGWERAQWNQPEDYQALLEDE